MSEPLYDYSDDKHVIKRFRMRMRNMRESIIPADLLGVSYFFVSWSGSLTKSWGRHFHFSLTPMGGWVGDKSAAPVGFLVQRGRCSVLPKYIYFEFGVKYLNFGAMYLNFGATYLNLELNF